MPKRAADLKSTTAKAGDSAKRAARTGVQGAAAVAVIIQGINLFGPRPLTPEQTAWATVAGTMLVSLLMNLLEELGMPALLKNAPPPAPPTDALDERKFEALATALGNQGNAIERLENALLDLRADRGLNTSGFQVSEAENPAGIFTGRPAGPWPPGGLG